MIFLNFILGFQIAKIDTPGIDIDYYARGYLMRLLILNKGHDLNTRIMAQALTNTKMPGQALALGYKNFHINKQPKKKAKKLPVLVLARNESDYNSFLSLNNLSHNEHKRIVNSKDITGKKMTVILSPGWPEKQNAIDLLHKLSCKRANIIDAEEAGYQ